MEERGGAKRKMNLLRPHRPGQRKITCLYLRRVLVSALWVKLVETIIGHRYNY